MTKGISQGIIKAFQDGPVRSVSIMAVGRAYDYAVASAKENPGLDIGIHLCLTEEKPILTKEEINTLAAGDGYFLKSHKKFFLHYFMGKFDFNEVRKELSAQIRKVLETGINISHIDSHGHIHILPEILKIVTELAERYSIPVIRYPYERLKTPGAGFSRRMQNLILNNLCFYSRQRFNYGELNNILGGREFFGFLHSGRMSQKSLNGILKAVNEGVTEIACHPGIEDNEGRCYAHWGYAWNEELDTLISAEAKRMIGDLNIELVSFRDILCKGLR